MIGKNDAVKNILATCSEWKDHTVHELIEEGGVPRLLKVRQYIPTRGNGRVLAMFVQPNGRFVDNVIIPLPTLCALYPEAAQKAISDFSIPQ